MSWGIEQSLYWDGVPARGAGNNIGAEIFALAAEIFPICRSITGNGVRETLACLGRHIPLQIREIPSGTHVFDWTIPREWNIRDAYIRSGNGELVVDFRKSNLHVMSYSVPVRARIPLSELRGHIFTLPNQPDRIPYRTSYYAERWGFCMSQEQFDRLPDGIYEVCIDSSLEEGSLTYAEYVHQGDTDEEVLLSAHVCHPSLANDNCSGLALLTLLAERLRGSRTRFSYRFLFAPGTIGAIAWLAANEHRVSRIKHGLVVSCVGDEGGPTYKKSRQGNASIDRAMVHALQHRSPPPTVFDFFPYGYDERQFCSPGFNLPVGLFQRSQFGKFPEYHTSADDLNFIKRECLTSSYESIMAALSILENDCYLWNTLPKCEPQLGRRGLYDAVGGKDGPGGSMALLWVLNLSDGAHSLLDIAERADIPFDVILEAAHRLRRHGLVTGVGDQAAGRSSPDQAPARANSGQDVSRSDTAAVGNGHTILKAGSL